MSRPEKPIDWDHVDHLLQCGCLGTEIAAHYNMNCHTFYDRVVKKYNMTFTEYQSERKQKGDSLLRQAQFEKALKKDNSMLIWLGKQRLGQKDNHDQKNIAEATIQNFAAIMQQLTGLQTDKKSSTIIEINPERSELDAGAERPEGGKESIF